ncbi:hypothetical protein [Maritimibacter sp. HL-12]|jgi:hypothetical protein|uniref:hypothetical protein n=1 Tax=Maritimibacter sp. HL-12 TaxID=1162418 RepID=UPI00111C1C08|nr:hypothetical protein [Maritimibacter sp. HL-12]
MNEESPGTTDGSEGNLLHLADKQVERILRELDVIIEELAARSSGADVKAKAAAIDLRKAIQTVFEERHRIGKFDGKDGSNRRGDGLDLDAARAEIGCRLARLRKSADAGGVSGGIEG